MKSNQDKILLIYKIRPQGNIPIISFKEWLCFTLKDI